MQTDGETPVGKEAEKVILPLLPKFVFMDEYQVFKGPALLNEVNERVGRGAPIPEEHAAVPRR